MALQKPNKSRALVCLGDALLRIQAPNQAAQAFAQALDRDPSDALLAAKIG